MTSWVYRCPEPYSDECLTLVATEENAAQMPMVARDVLAKLLDRRMSPSTPLYAPDMFWVQFIFFIPFEYRKFKSLCAKRIQTTV
jgi:hypothetical protein